MSSYIKTDLLKELSSQKLVENEHVELKSKWNQEYGKSISAFGNTEEGGWLLIGVNDAGLVLNQNLNWLKKQKDRIESHISQYLESYATVQSISIETVNNKNFILIEIINPKVVVSWNGKFYKRVGTRTEEMTRKEKQEIELNRPGFDFSNRDYNEEVNPSLVLDFAKFLKNGNEAWLSLSAEDILSKLNIKDKNVSGILFGNFPFRVAHYNKDSKLIDQYEGQGLHSLLKEDFIKNIQSWTRTKGTSLIPGSLSVTEETPYPDSVVREVLVNAVAHSSFEKQKGNIIVELYKNRIKVSNHCSARAEAFINKKFSQAHSSYNPFLMKILRNAKFSDELGTGKNEIFKHMLESGRREPLFEYQKISEDYGIWSVTIYNEQPNKNFLKLLKKIKALYKDNIDKYRMAATLILWKDKTLEDIISYTDEYHTKIIAELLSDNDSPFLSPPRYFKQNEKNLEGRILLKRWAKVQLEGQDSKVFSKGEENNFKEILQNYVYKENRDGYITNKEARKLFGLSNSQSEIVQLSKLFQQWEKDGFMEKGKRRRDWRVKEKPKS